MDAETRAYLDQAIGAMRQDFAGLREEFRGLRGEVTGLHGEVTGLHGEVTGLHGEVTGLHGEVADLRGEVTELHSGLTGLQGEVGGLRGGFTGLRGELTDLRTEVRESAVETRRHFDVTAEALRHEVQIVAEGVVTANVAIERLGTELRAEMNSRFAVVDAAFIQVRRDFEDLRARL